MMYKRLGRGVGVVVLGILLGSMSVFAAQPSVSDNLSKQMRKGFAQAMHGKYLEEINGYDVEFKNQNGEPLAVVKDLFPNGDGEVVYTVVLSKTFLFEDIETFRRLGDGEMKERLLLNSRKKTIQIFASRLGTIYAPGSAARNPAKNTQNCCIL